MWPFTIKKKEKRSRFDSEGYGLSQLIDRQNIEDLHKNDAQLRVWLPEPCKQALDETIKLNQATGSRYMRELLVVYLYGEHELLRMRSEKIGIYYKPPPSPVKSSNAILYSRAAASEMIPGLGKNIFPIKVFIHEKIKNDLQALADSASIPLSQFVREILVSHFLGHTLWQERIRLWTPAQEEIGRQWEEGKFEAEIIYGDIEESGDVEYPDNFVKEYFW